MRDTELYQHLLGLVSPWSVARVELTLSRSQVDVWAEHSDSAVWCCPECGKAAPLYDHSDERSWRHLDSCQFKTILHARPPRVKCGEHGVRQVKLPWAESSGRFTSLFERLAIDVLKETSVLGATTILRISWDEAWGIMLRAVVSGKLAKKADLVETIGVDEKAVAKGQTYITLVCDLQRATVEFIADNRTTESLDAFYEGLTAEQRSAIKAVAMDMWPAYIGSFHDQPRAGRQEQDRLRSIPHRQAHGRGCRQSTQGRESRAHRSGRRDAGGHEAPLAVAPGKPSGEAPRLVRETTSSQPEDGQGVGPGRVPARLVGVHPEGMGDEVVEELVLLGDSLQAGASHRSGTDDQQSPG
jgi:transposase